MADPATQPISVVLPDLVVERNDSRGGRFAVRIPYAVKDGTMVVDYLAAFGAAELLKSAANERHGEPVYFRPRVQRWRQKRHG